MTTEPKCGVRSAEDHPPCGEPAVALALRVDFAVSGYVCTRHEGVALNSGYIVQPLSSGEHPGASR